MAENGRHQYSLCKGYTHALDMLHIAHGPKVESLAVDRSDSHTAGVVIVVKTDGTLKKRYSPEHATGPLPLLPPKDSRRWTTEVEVERAGPAAGVALEGRFWHERERGKGKKKRMKSFRCNRDFVLLFFHESL